MAGISRKELAAKLAAQTGMSKDVADKDVANVFDLLAEELASGNQVSLHGFGIFSVTETQARTGRNPATGEVMQIPAGRKVKFKPAANLKRSLE